MSSDDEAAVRAKLQTWLQHSFEPRFRADHLAGELPETRASARSEWEQRLLAGGWLAASWPGQYGGGDLAPWLEVVIEEELAIAGAPELVNLIGFRLVGPVLLEMGTPAQCHDFLPAILAGDDLWCQGFSEPGAGSDLAALQTFAEDRGDHYVVNGQKVWTSWADQANRCLLLARTDRSAAKHRGISALLLDMDTPGVTVRPIRQLTGEAEFSEVFFDDVVVPKSRLLGEPGQGWDVAKLTLLYERGTNFGYLAGIARTLRATSARLAARGPDVRPDAIARLVDVHVSLVGLQAMARDYLGRLAAGSAHPSESSLIKLGWTELDVELKQLDLDIAGADAVVGADAEHALVLHEALASKAETIYGGSSEIQRNLIAQRLLGLPRSS